MKTLLIIIAVIVLVGIYYGISIYKKYEVSQVLVARATPFSISSTDTTTSVLVLGDSTAVGVGADKPENAVAGRLAKAINATEVENYAVSGAKVEDLSSQLAKAKLKQYSVIVVQVGANDVVRLHSAQNSAEVLAVALKQLPSTDKLIVFSAGNVGGTTFFPWFMNFIYTKLSIAYHAAFADVVTREGGTYVNLYEDPKTDPFVIHPEIYLAGDGFHPSSAGYILWFEKVLDKYLN